MKTKKADGQPKSVLEILDERQSYHTNNKKRQEREEVIGTLADLKPGVLEAYKHEVLRREIQKIKNILSYHEQVRRIREGGEQDD